MPLNTLKYRFPSRENEPLHHDSIEFNFTDQFAVTMYKLTSLVSALSHQVPFYSRRIKKLVYQRKSMHMQRSPEVKTPRNEWKSVCSLGRCRSFVFTRSSVQAFVSIMQFNFLFLNARKCIVLMEVHDSIKNFPSRTLLAGFHQLLCTTNNND